MTLQANQKFIDASHVAHLLTSGEKYADTLTFSVDRHYQGKDLSGALFVIRGVNSSGQLAMQTLEQDVGTDAIQLKWSISAAFTAVSGALALEIVCYEGDSVILKYAVTPMQVRESVLEAYSGGVDAIEEALKEMEQILEETRQTAVKLPIIQTGTWWLYDTNSGTYVDSGQPAQGADGKDGKDGADGTPGADGKDGADGADGKSAYQIWLDAGNSGTEEDFLASLKGESPDVSEIQVAAENAEATAANAKSIAEAVQADLVNYYKKVDTYSKDEVDQMISSIPKFSVAVVSALPASDISDTTVYLVKSGDETGNLYTEYIYVSGKWEQLGTQSLDLSGYYTSTQVDGLMGGKVDKVSGKGLSAEDFTTAYKEKLDSIEAGATKIAVDTSLSATSTNPVQNKAIKSALDGKAASSHTHDYLPLDGVANSAAKLQTARGINGVGFDGTAGISVPIYCYQSHLLSGYADTPWVKIADTTITATWEAAWIDLFLEGEKGDINHRAGVIRASVVTGAENKVLGALNHSQ